MKRYEHYSSVNNLLTKEIPSHWTMRRNRVFLRPKFVSVGQDANLYPLLSLTTNGIILRDVESGKGKFPKDFDAYQVVEPNDIVFCLFDVDETPRTVGLSSLNGMLTGAYDAFSIADTVNPRFINYYYTAVDDIKALRPYYTGLRKVVKKDKFMAISIPIPPIEEQEKIVAYLDKKITLIESCKCQRERELQTLNELKQSEIASVVTRGLNPNVPMKDSGIPWIGEIPAHWDTMRIRGLFSESDEKTEDESGTLLSLSQYTGITLKSEAGKTGMFEAESTVGYKVVHPGQFVMNIMLAWNGSYAVSDLEGIISPAYCVFDFRIDCNKKYYDYLLRTKAYSGAFKTQSRGIIDSRLRLYPYKFYAFRTLVPPIEEQDAIVAYIDSKISKIDAMIDALKIEIERLSEYKQRLISDVVTGQINVQNEQV